MANLTKKPNFVDDDVVEGSVGEGSVVEESAVLRSGNAKKRVEKNVEGNVEWEKGSLEDVCPGDEVLTEHSRPSSGIPGPYDDDDEYEDMDYEFEAYRYGKRKYSQHFDYDYMPMSDPEDEEAPAPPKINTAGRGKVSPTMHTWGLAEAQKEYEELMAKSKAQMEEEEKSSGRVLRSSTKKGKGKGKGRTKGRGQKKSGEELENFLSEANSYAEKVLEESQRNPPPVPQEVVDQVDREWRLRKEMEKEIDQELENSVVEPTPIAGPSQLAAPSVAGTLDTITDLDQGDLDDRPIEDLKAVAAKKLTTIVTVAAKSGNLQGRYVRDLKDAAKCLREVIDCLAVRPDGEELRRLKTANHNLRRELEEIRRDMKELRQELRDRRQSSPLPTPQIPTPAPPPVIPLDLPPALRDFNPDEFLEKVQRMVAITCGTIVTARIEALGLPPPPIVRPPLAADLGNAAMSGTPEATSSNVQESWATVTRKGKKGRAKKTVAPPVVAVATPAVISAGSNVAVTPIVSEPVLTGPTAVPSAPKPAARPKPRKLMAPRSSAVVITLEPEAIEKGISYKDALTEARKTIPVEELAVERVNLRQTATGARIIELFGPESGTKADNLAAKLREKLSGVAKVTRPIKCTDVRIVGLDDSIERHEIVSVLAEKSGFCGDQIKVGEVRPGPRGGSVIASIPTEGAKKLIDAGRVLIGWSSAQVQALDPRPLRCFKCMGVGHTRQLCPSPYDRSDVCFRCGRFGHKAAGCFEEARCAVCEDASRPFRHTMGGRDCNPPPLKGKAVTSAVPGPAVPQEQHQENDGHNMSVQYSDRDSLEE